MLVARPFIEIDFYRDKWDSTWTDIQTFLIEINWEGTTKEFLKQEFKKEFITKYFEGWVERDTDVYSYSLPHTGRQHAIDFLKYNRYRILSAAMWADWLYHFKPKTLDHFISDCQRAGVQLEWRLPE